MPFAQGYDHLLEAQKEGEQEAIAEGLFIQAELTVYPMVCETQPNYCFCGGHRDLPQAEVLTGSPLDKKLKNLTKNLWKLLMKERGF